MGNQHTNHARVYATETLTPNHRKEFLAPSSSEHFNEAQNSAQTNVQNFSCQQSGGEHQTNNLSTDDSSAHDFNFDTTEFIYSHSIPYSISVPDYCNVRMEEPFVIINGNEQITQQVDAQIILQVVAHYAKDCLELALKEWPHAHWERFKLDSVKQSSGAAFYHHFERNILGDNDEGGSGGIRSRPANNMHRFMTSTDDMELSDDDDTTQQAPSPSRESSSLPGFVSRQSFHDPPLRSSLSNVPLKHIISACRTMHTVQAMKVTTISNSDVDHAGEQNSTRYILNPKQDSNPFQDSETVNPGNSHAHGQKNERSVADSFSLCAAIDSRVHEFTNVHVEKTLTWVRLTIYVLDAGDGLFYWLTGITEAEAPRQIFQKRNLFRPPRMPYIENQVSVYDPKLLDPIQHVIFSHDYEFPMWHECMWSAPFRIPNYDMEMRLPPIWRLIDNFFIISPIQLFSQNQIQEHFFFSLSEHPSGPNEVVECCASIVQKNQQPRVQTVTSFQKMLVSGREGMYSIFRMEAPPNSPYPFIEKIVINVPAAESGQWVFSYISSYGFRSMNLWKQFLREIRIGQNFENPRHDNETQSNNSQMFHEVFVPPLENRVSTMYSISEETQPTEDRYGSASISHQQK
uniref:Uncharacterized protein n=1 Tax=Percolomonas cosmopolitus TaxID=63605 RepID=A0A7S1KPC0_9EUKA|mmetsp:Transcript_3197/g.12230  ORF Transcript_3197/g.12230 Transcript_3197/m.12230 type:complete len:629 (+) Transcript_3197:385-2271(+)|eukprot:CAMPEP_0117435836 /NCGR_PEP_ID=MMETSP0759-20121206/690_1 /TAXON_ID=63605 /ORGANISM="Percolomonas cosmopolitus, Strain WS" /LENGTH=628 /DNA_ID=CAMNT_0005227403 /DNA_START=352 /DNA_END=2238 /DNA_ORIENTATION=-